MSVVGILRSQQSSEVTGLLLPLERARARETEAKEQGERESGGREREERGAWEEVRVEGYVG